MFILFLSIIHVTLSQDLIGPLIFSDCRHLILPSLCQCYHSGNQSQLSCHNIQLRFIPKLPNNMHWYALDFSLNKIKSIDSYVFSDIYVEKLNLKLNHLQSIDVTAFDQIQNLKQLYIDHNQLKEFDPNTLSSPGASLEIFDISYNPLRYLDLGGVFRQLSVVQEFYAVSCQLNNESLFTLLKLTDNQHHLRIMDLSFNNLTSLCNNLFDHFYNLIELRLNNNQIYSLDNYFIRPLNYIRILDLSFNSIEHVPNLFSSSLEVFNLSSNNIRQLSDYFAANLHSIRTIDFDSNKYLSTISSHAFCFINILTIEKLSFRFDSILLLNSFNELLCRLYDNNIYRNVIDLNHNPNLKCNCLLVQFEKYLISYYDLTCTQQGQDRYFISKLTSSFSNCTWDVCLKQKKEVLCEWTNAEKLNLNGTCQMKVEEKDNSTDAESFILTTPITTINDTNTTRSMMIIQNATVLFNATLKSCALTTQRFDYDAYFIFLLFYLTFHRLINTSFCSIVQ